MNDVEILDDEVVRNDPRYVKLTLGEALDNARPEVISVLRERVNMAKAVTVK